MTVQQDPGVRIDVGTAAGEPPEQPPSRGRGRPNLSGDLQSMLEPGPAFASALRGYDRLQVDNYVAWAENELAASRRAITELVKRLGEREAALQRAQQVLAQSPRGRELTAVSDRVAEMLRLAAEEADAARTEGAAEAAEIVAQAQVEADLIKRRAQQLEAQAATRLEKAERLQAEARALENRSRVEAEHILQKAAAERERLDAEAERTRTRAATAAAEQLAAEEEQSRRTREAAEAAAAARVAEADKQLQMLPCRQEGVRDFLHRVTEQVDAALRLLADDSARKFSFSDNLTGESSRPGVSRPDATHILVTAAAGRRGARTASHGLAHHGPGATTTGTTAYPLVKVYPL